MVCGFSSRSVKCSGSEISSSSELAGDERLLPVPTRCRPGDFLFFAARSATVSGSFSPGESSAPDCTPPGGPPAAPSMSAIVGSWWKLASGARPFPVCRLYVCLVRGISPVQQW